MSNFKHPVYNPTSLAAVSSRQTETHFIERRTIINTIIIFRPTIERIFVDQISCVYNERIVERNMNQHQRQQPQHICPQNVVARVNGLLLPSSSSLMSLAAWMPSSFRLRSIRRLRAAAARSSADCAQPMVRMASTQNVLGQNGAVLHRWTRRGYLCA